MEYGSGKCVCIPINDSLPIKEPLLGSIRDGVAYFDSFCPNSKYAVLNKGNTDHCSDDSATESEAPNATEERGTSLRIDSDVNLDPVNESNSVDPEGYS